MDTGEPSRGPVSQPISEVLVDVLDAVLYLDKKLVVQAHGVRLHPAEMHLLACLAAGMGFSEIGRHFGISKAAVSQTVSRLSGKGLLEVSRDRGRTAEATVALTPLGQDLLGRVLALRAGLAGGLDACLAGYSAAERAAVARFVRDLRGFVRAALTSAATGAAEPESGGRS